jgi:DNA-binding PadR family transcriptional regulator
MPDNEKKFITSWKRKMQRPFIQILILLTLYFEENCTGYFVTEQLRARISNKLFKISAGTIYPQLNKLQEFNLVESNMQIIESAEIRPGTTRKIFILTPEGIAVTKAVILLWDELVTTIEDFQMSYKNFGKLFK